MIIIGHNNDGTRNEIIGGNRQKNHHLELDTVFKKMYGPQISERDNHVANVS